MTRVKRKSENKDNSLDSCSHDAKRQNSFDSEIFSSFREEIIFKETLKDLAQMDDNITNNTTSTNTNSNANMINIDSPFRIEAINANVNNIDNDVDSQDTFSQAYNV